MGALKSNVILLVFLSLKGKYLRAKNQQTFTETSRKMPRNQDGIKASYHQYYHNDVRTQRTETVQGLHYKFFNWKVIKVLNRVKFW